MEAGAGKKPGSGRQESGDAEMDEDERQENLLFQGQADSTNTQTHFYFLKKKEGATNYQWIVKTRGKKKNIDIKITNLHP